jgi:hypothetical protein
MVDALRTVKMLLTPAGCVIDVRPVAVDPDLGVCVGHQVEWLGVLGETDHGIEYRQADDAMAYAIETGIFAREAATTFVFYRYADSLADLRAYFVEHWTDAVIDPATATRIEQAVAAVSGPSRIVVREHVQMARLRRGPQD